MMPARAQLPDGRLHFQWGPIDLVIGADGEANALEAAHADAWQRFGTVLPELVAELPRLRSAAVAGGRFEGRVAMRMQAACAQVLPRFVTPMAAVAGAVADELAARYAREGIERAYVNNGGDIALYLRAGRSWRVGLYADVDATARRRAHDRRLDGDFEVDASMPVRGVATSGWRGRSLSLGIADSVTVLAGDAAAADVAATLIANAVDVGHPSIRRAPASQVREDTDLGERLVTVAVGPLDAHSVTRALDAGEREARALQCHGRVFGAMLWLAGCCRMILPAAGIAPAVRTQPEMAGSESSR